MKVLITGGNGYIAQRLMHYLHDIFDVVSEPRSTLDLLNEQAVSSYLSRESYDVVIHTAVVGGSRLKQDDNYVADANLMMYYHLLNNRNKFGRLISFGSGAEMYMTDTPYGMSKNIISKSIASTKGFYNLRIFAVFDECELPTRFIRSSIMRYLNRQPMEIHSNKIMDFYYMKDLVSMVRYYISEKNPPKEVNCSYGNKHTLHNIATMINRLDTHSVPILVNNKDKLEFYCGEASELPINTLGLEVGLKETFQRLVEDRCIKTNIDT